LSSQSADLRLSKGKSTAGGGGRKLTTATRPVLRLAVQSATGELARVFPTGPALLEALGDLNPDVRDALDFERASLDHRGYPEDLPLPALWWGASA
jgi:hypothetical protein